MEIIIPLIIVLVASIIIAKDASSRGMSGIGWGIFTFFIFIVAVPLYLVVRKPTPSGNRPPDSKELPISQLINKFRAGDKLWPGDVERLADQSLREHRIAALICGQTGNSLLHVASEAGNLSGVDKLIRAGAEISRLNNSGKTSIELAASDAIRRLLTAT